MAENKRLYLSKGQRLKTWPSTLRRQAALAVKAREAKARTARMRGVLEEVMGGFREVTK